MAIDLSSASVTEGTAITVTMSFGNLAEDSDRATTDYLFRADVVDADGCEEQAGGYGLGVDRKINLVDEDPEVRRGTISAGCPAGDYTVRASISDANGGELASATAGFSVAAPEPPASSDAALSGLALSGVTLEFDSDTTTYTAEVGNDVAETTITPTVNDDGATFVVRLDGAADDDGIIPLAVGENAISVLVTAEDGETTRTYTVTVTRTAPDPTVSIALSSSDGVEEGDEIAVTMSFGHLTFDSDRATTDYIFRADVKDSENGDADGCEDQAGGYGLGVDRKINLVDEDPEVRRGAISADCPAGVYSLRVSISADSVEVASATAEFFVLPPLTAVEVEEPEEEDPRVARQTAGSSLKVVYDRQAGDIYDFELSWTDGGTCASGTNYYGYGKAASQTAVYRDIGNVASTASTMSGSFTISFFADNFADGFVELYCGTRTSGRLVASLQIPDFVVDGTYYFPAPSSALSGLTVGGVPVPDFAADTTAYSTTVDNSVERTTVAATVEAAGSSYAVTAPADADVDTDGHQVDLAVSVNPVITVVVTAVDDTTTTYTVTVTRRAPTAMTVVWSTSDDDRTLALTWTDGGTCASGTNYYGYAFVKIGSDERYFDIDNVASTAQTLTGTLTSHYFAGTLPPGSTTEAHLYCGARGASGSRLVAKVEITGLNSGTFRTPTPALSALSLTGVTDADLGFEKDTLNYDVTVGNAVASTTVAATVDREGDTFVVNLGGAEDDDQVIPLSPGDNVITVVVSAEDGSVSTTYTVTVKREGPPVTIGAGAAEATEGDVLTFTLRRAGSMVGTVPVKFNVSETGEMVAAAAEGMRTETIPDGSDIRIFQVATVRFDQVWEAHSTVTVTLQGDDAYMVTGDPASMLVRDDDFPASTVVMGLNPNPVAEGAGQVVATLTVTTDRDEMPHGPRLGALDFFTSEGMAVGVSDYSGLSGKVHFYPDDFSHVDIGGGEMRYQAELTREIVITDDSVHEETEDFRVRMQLPPGAAGVTLDPATDDQTVTITDDDLPVVSISAAATEAAEGDALSFTVTRDGSTHADLIVTLDVSETGALVPRANEGAQTVTILATDTSATFTVQTAPADDTWDEHSTVTVTVADNAAHNRGAPFEAETEVKDNDFPAATAVLSFDGGQAEVDEGGRLTVWLTVTVDAPNQRPHHLQREIRLTTEEASPRSAVEGTDYTAEDENKIVDPGEFTQKTDGRWQWRNHTGIAITQDTDTEGAETFLVKMEAVTQTIGMTTYHLTPPIVLDAATATLTATINASDAVTVSSDATLRGLSFSRIAGFRFVAGTETYRVTPLVNLPSTTVRAATTDPGASYVVKLGGVEDADRVIPLAEGDNVITVVVTAQDGESTRTYTVTVDNPAHISGAFPVITSLDGDEDVSGPFTVRFTFLKAANRVEAMPVSGFVLSDISVTNGMASGLAKARGDDKFDGAIWEATITPATYGMEVVVSLAEDVVTEGNQAASLTVTTRSDSTAPTATLRANVVYFEDGSQSSVITRPTGLHIGFDERVTGLEINDFEVTNGEIGYLDVDADGNGHAVLVPKVSDASHITVKLKANAVHDLANNGNAAAQVVLHVSPDETPPEIVGFKQRLRRVDEGTHVWALTFVFSEPVTEFGADDVSISSGTKSTESRANHAYGTRWAIDIESDDGETPITVRVAARRFSDGNNDNTKAFSGEIDRTVPPPASDD